MEKSQDGIFENSKNGTISGPRRAGAGPRVGRQVSFCGAAPEGAGAQPLAALSPPAAELTAPSAPQPEPPGARPGRAERGGVGYAVWPAGGPGGRQEAPGGSPGDGRSRPEPAREVPGDRREAPGGRPEGARSRAELASRQS